MKLLKVRRSKGAVALGAAIALALSMGGVVLAAQPAAADATSTLPIQWYGPGVHSVTVPLNATSVHLYGLGAAGKAGYASVLYAGGAGGSGTAASEDVPVGPDSTVKPGLNRSGKSGGSFRWKDLSYGTSVEVPA